MDTAVVLRNARSAAGLSQRALAARAGTSQATVSAYESGLKVPSVQTLDRLLAATGAKLTVERDPGAAPWPNAREQAQIARRLTQVLDLAEALPARRRGGLHYPRLTPSA